MGHVTVAKLVHGSALFPWTRSPLLSPVLKLSGSEPSTEFQEGGVTAATVSPNAASLAPVLAGIMVMMLSPLKDFHGEMPSLLTVRWNGDRTRCSKDFRAEYWGLTWLLLKH